MQLHSSLSTLLSVASLAGLARSAALPIDSIKQRSASPEKLFNLEKRDCSTHSSQWTTFYPSGTSSTQTTACGTHYDPTQYIVAISVDLENDLNDQGIDWCGTQVSIVGPNGTPVTATVEDSNATGDLGYYALDSSPAVYDAIGGSSTDPNDPGQWKINWTPSGNCI